MTSFAFVTADLKFRQLHNRDRTGGIFKISFDCLLGKVFRWTRDIDVGFPVDIGAFCHYRAGISQASERHYCYLIEQTDAAMSQHDHKIEIIAADESIFLRRVIAKDLGAFYRWYIDPDIQRFMANPNWKPDCTKDDYRQIFLRRHLLQTGSAATVAVCLSGNNLPVGMVNYFDLDRDKGSCEIGVVIGEKKLWNRGVGSAAVKLTSAYLFSKVHLDRIYCHILETNAQSIRMFEKCGFVFDKIAFISDTEFLRYVLRKPEKSSSVSRDSLQY